MFVRYNGMKLFGSNPQMPGPAGRRDEVAVRSGCLAYWNTAARAAALPAPGFGDLVLTAASTMVRSPSSLSSYPSRSLRVWYIASGPTTLFSRVDMRASISLLLAVGHPFSASLELLLFVSF